MKKSNTKLYEEQVFNCSQNVQTYIARLIRVFYFRKVNLNHKELCVSDQVKKILNIKDYSITSQLTNSDDFY